VLTVAGSFGYVRETNYGRLFDVRAGRNASSLAFTGLPSGRTPTILLRPELTLHFSLEPGDCVVFDNTRLMHSRTGFTATGERHLQGCYADLDGVESTVAVLARRVSRASQAT
jgi:gamma-butyrobetaine dioxygenase